QFRGSIFLHDGIMRKVRENFLTASFRNIRRDQHKVQFALAAPQCVAADQQRARLEHEWKQSFDGLGRCRIAHYASFTLSLRPLICVRFILAMIPFACSEDTSTNKCRSRTSTVPTTFPGRPVSPATAFTISIGAMPIS